VTPVVCVCRHVPEDAVEKACQQGATCLDDVRDMTGACTDCGDCAPDIEEILACYAGQGSAPPGAVTR
jgi:bacterioferritin-associated ferredoxin